jgi:tRNA nucleotidyltransferase/poly(A) polymerase
VSEILPKQTFLQPSNPECEAQVSLSNLKSVEISSVEQFDKKSARAIAKSIVRKSMLNAQQISQHRYYFATNFNNEEERAGLHSSVHRKPSLGLKPVIQLTLEEEELFKLLRHVVEDKNLSTTLRVAGGWVRDKLLATEEFHGRFDGAAGTFSTANKSMGRKGSSVIGGAPLVNNIAGRRGRINGTQNGQVVETPYAVMAQPVDIDIALDNMLGRAFADELNDWLVTNGRKTVSVGMMLKNPEKSKHLETATMKINDYWIDFVNLRTEEYAGDSRIPDQMQIGTAEEDAFRRDLTINSLFYNINTGLVEDLTGRGLDDLLKGVVSTPLAPLTTLLDDPLRVLRSVRFAARLRFSMDDDLRNAAKNPRVHYALAAKVSRERVGAELDLMLRSKDPVGAMRLLLNLHLIDTVFPVARGNTETMTQGQVHAAIAQGLVLLGVVYDHLSSCKINPPVWCQNLHGHNGCAFNTPDQKLTADEETRRLMWYASFLKPLRDAEIMFGRQRILLDRDQNQPPTKTSRRKGKKANQSLVMKIMIDDLKRSVKEGEDVEKMQIAADEITALMLEGGGGISSSTILLSGIRISYEEVKMENGRVDLHTTCTMAASNRNEGREGVYNVHSEKEQDPMWIHAMNFRWKCYSILAKIGDRWQAAFMLSLAEQLSHVYKDDENYAIEGDVIDQIYQELAHKVVAQYDTFAGALLELGLVGLWNQKPLLTGNTLQERGILPHIPKGPAFRLVMDEQRKWMILHPGGSREGLITYLRRKFPQFTEMDRAGSQ